MIRKLCAVVLVVVLGLALSAPLAFGAEKKAAKEEAKGAVPEEAQVTQCELAGLLAQVLGLARFLPPAPSCQQCIVVMMDNSISPVDGWQGDKIVTKADLARVIVQAMKRQAEISDPDDPKAWIDFLKSIGIPLDAVGETVSYLDPLVEPVARNVVAPRTDPLWKRQKFSPLDETQYGTDMEFVPRITVLRVIAEVEQAAPARRPRRVTED